MLPRHPLKCKTNLTQAAKGRLRAIDLNCKIYTSELICHLYISSVLSDWAQAGLRLVGLGGSSGG